MQDDFFTILTRASRHMVIDALGLVSLAVLLIVSLHLPGLI